MIYNVVLDWIYANHGHRLTSWNQLFLTPAWLEQYARGVFQMGCPLTNCFGFVDGTPQMRDFNSAMSRVRISVEWLFGDISTYFKFIDFKKNLKIGMSAVGKQYIVCALMRNALTCLYGNNTSEYFQLDPPNVETYFA